VQIFNAHIKLLCVQYWVRSINKQCVLHSHSYVNAVVCQKMSNKNRSIRKKQAIKRKYVLLT